MSYNDLFNGDYEDSFEYKREDIIILSFKPYAYEKIKSGIKRMEYRTRFRKRPTIAIIYVSTPVKEIRGIMFMGRPLIGTPQQIGEIAESKIKGNGKAVYEYLKDGRHGYAIPIEKYTEISPLKLSQLQIEYGFKAPQSYVGLHIYPQLEKYFDQVIEGMK